MRVAVLTSPHHVYGNYLMKRLLAREDLCRVVAIVESTTLLPKKTFLEGLATYLRVAGPRFFVAQAVKAWFFRIGAVAHRLAGRRNSDSAFFSYERLLDSRPLMHQTSNINSRQSVEFLASQDLDLLVLVFFGQILGDEVLDIARLGCINFHPSLLPRHRGLMPIFWALSLNEQQTGASVHLVDRGIDTGRLIAQQAVPIRDDDTEHSLYARTCRIGADILIEAIRGVRDGSGITGVAPPAIDPCYHSLPTREAVRRFLRNGRRFFRVRDLVNRFECL